MGKKTSTKYLRYILLVLLSLGLAGGYLFYNTFLKSNILLDGKKSKIVLIPSSATYEDLLDILYEENIVANRSSFEWLANKMELAQSFHPGRYRIMASMNNRQLVNLFKSGKQEKVKITFNSADRTLEHIISDISAKLETSEEELEHFFNNEALLLEKYGCTKENIRTLFVPGSYEVEWTCSIEDFMQLMQEKYEFIWNDERKSLARKTRLNPQEIIILASIVQCESAIKTEQQKIAGVYINRLNIGMPLQADPTLIYANKKFDAQRVWNADMETDSPYNTYKYTGLPPGPICLPFTQAVDAVLNYSHHKFLYFCAKPDLSGYSDFSASLEEHNKYRNAYRREMDKRGIR